MKVKDLTDKQLKQLLTHMDSIGEFDEYGTPTELWNTDILNVAYWNETPQGHEYWNDIVNNFNNK